MWYFQWFISKIEIFFLRNHRLDFFRQNPPGNIFYQETPIGMAFSVLLELEI